MKSSRIPFARTCRAATLIAALLCGRETAAERSPEINDEAGIVANAGFEAGAVGAPPADWTAPPVPGFQVAISADDAAQGTQCATIESVGEAGSIPFGNLIQRVDAASWQGQRVRFRAAVRAEVETGRNQAQLWLRVDRTAPDGSRALGAFDNMGDRPITDGAWKYYEIVGDVADDAAQITVGMMLLGKGRAWIDDVSLEAVGADVPVTAKAPWGAGRSGTPLENIKPGVFEVAAAMRILSAPGAEPPAAEATSGGPRQVVLIPLPLAYRDQAPATFSLAVDPPHAVEELAIEGEGSHNRVLRVTLAPHSEWQYVDISFKSLVLVQASDFAGAPSTAEVPAAWPEDAAPWLAATWCADADHERIRALAAEIRAGTNDVPEIIRRVQSAAANVFRSAEGQVESLTAVEALDKRGSCTSCANLVAALLRAAGVPARIVAGYPSWSGPLQTHYIVEAYVPGYGWYPMESTMGRAPWPNTHQVQVAVVPAEHESEAKAGARLGIAGGVPYLSLTELPDNVGSLFAIGTIEGARGCDHECRLLAPLEGTPHEWEGALADARVRWQQWLEAPHVLDDRGRLSLGPNARPFTAKTVAEAIAQLQ